MNNNDNMKDNKIAQALQKIEPDETTQERMYREIIGRTKSAGKENQMNPIKRNMFWLTTVTAASVILAVSVIYLPKILNQDAANLLASSSEESDASTETASEEYNITQALASSDAETAANQPETLGNPYNLSVKENTTDGLNLKINDIWGDEFTMHVDIEISSDKHYFTDDEHFFSLYPNFRVGSDMIERNRELVQEDESFSSYSGYGMGERFRAENGKMYWEFEINCSSRVSDKGIVTKLPLPKDINFSISYIGDEKLAAACEELEAKRKEQGGEDDEYSYIDYSENGVKRYNSITLSRHGMDNLEYCDGYIKVSFSANYQPAPITVFDINEEISHANGNTTVIKEISVSDTSVFIDGIGFDADVSFIVNGERIDEVFNWRGGDWQPKDPLFSGCTGNANSYEPGFETSISGNFQKGFDKTTIDAIIVNGKEIKLNW